jgi:hypothetical protein
MSSKVIVLDALFLDYGPEAKHTRRETHQFGQDAMDRIWPKEESGLFQLRPKNNGDKINAELELLVPRDESQAATKAQITSAIRELRRAYWLMFLESEQTAISVPLLIVVTSWLVAIFVSFGIFAPSNATVMVTLIVCAVAVSAAIFIIMEMYAPFSGMLKISPVAVRDALDQMARE